MHYLVNISNNATNNAYIDVASENAAPTTIVLMILALASGCLETPSTALPAALPVPIPPPKQPNAASPAPSSLNNY